jgi:hypothetical protein
MQEVTTEVVGRRDMGVPGNLKDRKNPSGDVAILLYRGSNVNRRGKVRS